MFDLLSLANLTLVLATIIFILVVYNSMKTTHANLPPGPSGLPIVGNLLIMKEVQRSNDKLLELSKEYGNVVTLRLGQSLAFLLNGYDVIKEALFDQADHYSERPGWSVVQERMNGLIFNTEWKERRRFLLVSMRDFGLGKRSLDERIREEAQALIKELEGKDGQLFDMTTLLPYVTSNIICSIILGRRFEYDDKAFKELLDALNERLQSIDRANPSKFIPWLKYIFPKKKVQNTKLMETIKEWKTDHEASYDEENIRDLVDLFINESRKKGSTFDEQDLLSCTAELFAAGTETTSTTLAWALLYLIHNPQIQTKCREELHKEIGRSRTPEYADLKKVPYTQGVMNEVQRLANLVPMAIWHATNADTTLAGFSIPKGSIIIPNMWSALMDEKYFPNPQKLDPGRWVDQDGKMVKIPAFIPFSLGKRVCLGEQLARKEYFVFLATLLQNFEFTIPDKDNPPSLDGNHGAAVRATGPYQLKIRKL